MMNWVKNKHSSPKVALDSSPSPMPYRAGIYPSRSVLLLPLSAIPVVAYSYNVLMPPVIMAIVAFCSTVTLIPLSSQHLVRAGLRGRDLLKPYKQLV